MNQILTFQRLYTDGLRQKIVDSLTNYFVDYYF